MTGLSVGEVQGCLSLGLCITGDEGTTTNFLLRDGLLLRLWTKNERTDFAVLDINAVYILKYFL